MRSKLGEDLGKFMLFLLRLFEPVGFAHSKSLPLASGNRGMVHLHGPVLITSGPEQDYAKYVCLTRTVIRMENL